MRDDDVPPAALLKRIQRDGLETLLSDVAAAHHTNLLKVLGYCRKRTVVAARAEMCVRLYALGKSLPEIGDYLGRDHTSVLALLEREGVQRRSARDAWVAKTRPMAAGAAEVA
jgi:chromosomal replication initiation ATPase DnaA